MRTRYSIVLLLALALAASGCRKEYTLRLVVSGVIPIVPSDESTNPEELWLLVANGTDPAQLPVDSANVNVHRNGFYVEEQFAGSLEGSAGGPCIDPQGKYRWVSLADEHLELEVNSAKPGLSMERGPRVFPDSEDSPEARNFNWLASIDEAVGNLAQPDPRKRLAKELFAPTYERSGYPLMSARVRLQDGLVYASGMHVSNQTGEVERFTFVPSAGDSEEVALATSATVDVRVRGAVVFRRKKLSTGEDLEPYVLGPAPAGSTLTVVLQNEPANCHAEVGDRDFVINYSLLADPPSARVANEYPTPTYVTPPVDNGQCSPSRAIHPG
jgi:hypothetical protein